MALPPTTDANAPASPPPPAPARHPRLDRVGRQQAARSGDAVRPGPGHHLGPERAPGPIEFTEIDPRTKAPIEIHNQLSGTALATFLAKMVKTFIEFPPLGVVLVALLGVGVAEHVGFIGALIKGLLSFTPRLLLTPMLMVVGIISHSAGDTGYVLVIPLGGVIFYAAGRHPLAGIAAAFAAVSGGFSANFLPSGLDPLLQGFTQPAAQIIDPARDRESALQLLVHDGLELADHRHRLVPDRPRHRAALQRDTPVDGDPADMPQHGPAHAIRERTGLVFGLGTLVVLLGLLTLACLPAESPLRNAGGDLTGPGAPLMDAIVPLIFLLFLFPAIAYGYVAGTVKSHRDIVKGMSKSMSTMGYYLVLAFFAAQFIYAFRESNLGILIAIKGANFLRAMNFPAAITILGVILITTSVNLLIGSASAKWALLGPIFVPMLMQLGLSPELTQAAYRVGDSSTNIITPLMPYFPLVVAYAQRYVKGTGIGTLIALMIAVLAVVSRALDDASCSSTGRCSACRWGWRRRTRMGDEFTPPGEPSPVRGRIRRAVQYPAPYGARLADLQCLTHEVAVKTTRLFLAVIAFLCSTRLHAQPDALFQSIAKRGDASWSMARQIWEWAEVGYKEHKSSKLLAGALEQAGFRVERGLAGIPTAFTATIGSGKPVIGIMGEYDALPGVSQDDVPFRKLRSSVSAGHACGHHLFGVASLSACLALGEQIQAGKIKGTLRFYGCPAEEGGSSRLPRARGAVQGLRCRAALAPVGPELGGLSLQHGAHRRQVSFPRPERSRRGVASQGTQRPGRRRADQPPSGT